MSRQLHSSNTSWLVDKLIWKSIWKVFVIHFFSVIILLKWFLMLFMVLLMRPLLICWLVVNVSALSELHYVRVFNFTFITMACFWSSTRLSFSGLEYVLMVVICWPLFLWLGSVFGKSLILSSFMKWFLTLAPPLVVLVTISTYFKRLFWLMRQLLWVHVDHIVCFRFMQFLQVCIAYIYKLFLLK